MEVAMALMIILATLLGVVALAVIVVTLLALIWPSIRGVVGAWVDWLESRFYYR